MASPLPPLASPFLLTMNALHTRLSAVQWGGAGAAGHYTVLKAGPGRRLRLTMLWWHPDTWQGCSGRWFPSAHSHSAGLRCAVRPGLLHHTYPWHLNFAREILRFKLTAKFPTRNSGSSASFSHTSGARCGLWQGMIHSTRGLHEISHIEIYHRDFDSPPPPCIGPPHCSGGDLAVRSSHVHMPLKGAKAWRECVGFGCFRG